MRNRKESDYLHQICPDAEILTNFLRADECIKPRSIRGFSDGLTISQLKDGSYELHSARFTEKHTFLLTLTVERRENE